MDKIITLEDFNVAASISAEEILYGCCASNRWVKEVSAGRPFAGEAALFERTVSAWFEACGEADYLEAFAGHPRIGDLESLQKKFAATADWAGTEQSGVNRAPAETLEKLAKANEIYENRFGFIFIVCATGKSAEEMLAVLEERLQHSREEELAVAATEQFKITLIRLQKAILLEHPDWKKTSRITTHILDTSVGKPADRVVISLQKPFGATWQTIATGITNHDGRIPDLLAPGSKLPEGDYRMIFRTGPYYRAKNLRTFYPQVEIHFYVFDETHYHIPLLINPFGYTTYRGS